MSGFARPAPLGVCCLLACCVGACGDSVDTHVPLSSAEQAKLPRHLGC